VPEQLYVTESPCLTCAKAICEYRTINKVYYLHEYRLREGIDFLLALNVKVYRMTQAGYIIDQITGELVDAH
jgi:deoxycytidylate deaminase